MDIRLYQGCPPREFTDEHQRPVHDLLRRLGVEYQTAVHPEAYGMDVCRQVECALDTPICKNLFLCNRQQTRFVLLMMPGDKPFKTRDITSQLQCPRLSFAPEERMEELLGLHPGSVSPLGLMNDRDGKVTVAVDSDLMAQDRVGVHPCHNTQTVSLRMTDLLQIYLPAVGHRYQLVDLPRQDRHDVIPR